MVAVLPTTSHRRLWAAVTDRLRIRRYRSMSEFAEGELVLTTGDRKNLGYRFVDQPCHSLLCREFDSNHWVRHLVAGPTQSGKSTIAFILPLLYHLFERGEDVVAGVVDLAMVADMWSERILPML